ncbi:MAG TPA: hypothetical protein VF160_06955 [Candidatus Dormibacteraeota bacterium]
MAETERPGWRPWFDWAERALGARLEYATRTDEFAGFVTFSKRAEAAARRLYLEWTADALHRANIPAWSDLLRLSEQVSGLEKRVRDLSAQLEKRPRPRSSRRRPRSSAR